MESEKWEVQKKGLSRREDGRVTLSLSKRKYSALYSHPTKLLLHPPSSADDHLKLRLLRPSGSQ